MPDAAISVLSAVIGIVAGALATYITTRSRIRAELEATYDKSLRDARIAVYRELWKELQPLAKYSRPGPVSYSTVEQLSSKARVWYFETGGLYLSDHARDVYFELMDRCREVLEDEDLRAARETDLPAQRFDALREAGSRLRAAMAADVGTRRMLLGPN